MKRKKVIQSFLNIRNRILIFSLLATLVPSIGMGWLLNSVMHDTITEKFEQKLLDSVSIIDREINLWFKERQYDLRIFSSSYIITDNFTRYVDDIQNNPSQVFHDKLYHKNLVTYLTSVQNQFEYYTRLFIFDKEGNFLAASGTLTEEVQANLPSDAMEQVSGKGFFMGEVYFKDDYTTPFMLIGTSLLSEKSKGHIGVLAIEVQLQEFIPLLQANLFHSKGESSIMASFVKLSDGLKFLSISGVEVDGSKENMPGDIMQLFHKQPAIQDFTDYHGVYVVGIVAPLKHLDWGLIISEDYDKVYAKLISSRNRNVAIAIAFALIIGLVAYHFTTRIITPLTTLTKGALRVADGDLDVRLPVYINDELGLATRVFNEMVVKLHQSHEKLKELATTDALTHLVNRKRIMEILQTHFDHYKRYSTTFSVLMIDIDYFKKINDTYGHLAGDAVLKQVAGIFKKSLRSVDFLGRYGGEEFLVVLPETDGDEAENSAERVRQAVQSHIFLYEKQAMKVSVSIGVATASGDDKRVDSLIGKADDALYQAKDSGRNQVICASSKPSGEKVVPISGSVKK